MNIKKTKILSIGGGLASFGFVNFLRVSGIPSEDITVLGANSRPYDNFVKRCISSGITFDDRLRSDSSATPGNIWGWPSFGFRELAHDVRRGNIMNAVSLGAQLFTEPIFQDTYSPKLGQVVNAIDRESARISYRSMIQNVLVESITRFEGQWLVRGIVGEEYRYFLAEYLHIALGYQSNAKPDDASELFTLLGTNYSHVYENHEAAISSAMHSGGVFVVRGRGIAASRVIERLLKIAKHQKRLVVINLVRSSANPEAPSMRSRKVQPFNFPKDSFGGDQVRSFIHKNPQERLEYIKKYGATSTPNRKHWRKQIIDAERSGQFIELIGTLQRNNEAVLAVGKDSDFVLPITACIDATGLRREPTRSPPIRDLLRRGYITLGEHNTISLTNHFEAVSSKLQQSDLFFAGVNALGGSFAAVDSFAGINFAAQVAGCEVIHRINQTSIDSQIIPTTENMRVSAISWTRWARGAYP